MSAILTERIRVDNAIIRFMIGDITMFRAKISGTKLYYLSHPRVGIHFRAIEF